MSTITTADLLELQGDDETITPTALIDLLRRNGYSLSRRTFSFWQSQGLVPPALRVGSRGGVYPATIVELAAFVSDMRDRGLSIETTRELLPIWRHVLGSERSGCISVSDTERVARSLNLSTEANYHVPSVIEYLTSGFCENCLLALAWELKSGVRVCQSDGLIIRFAIAQISPMDGFGDLVAWTQLTLPGLDERPDIDDPTLIVLGLPIGIELRRHSCDHEVPPRTRVRRRACRTRKMNGQEVLQLSS